MYTYVHREIYQRYKASFRGKDDIHTRLMKNYKDIPQWWFHVLLAATITVSLALCIFLKKEVQLPWWGLLFASALAFIFTLPVSIITATTNQVIMIKHFTKFLRYDNLKKWIIIIMVLFFSHQTCIKKKKILFCIFCLFWCEFNQI